MDSILNKEIQKDTLIFTVEDCKIKKYFVKEMFIRTNPTINLLGQNINFCVYLKVEKYNNGIDSYTKELRISDCFLSKEELLQNLEK